MFADLVGFTSLSEKLDPEILSDLLGRYQACLADIIERQGGHLVSCFGDGALAYFGFPSAHENDAERAVLAGLDIVENVKHLFTDPSLTDASLAVRVGLHTGLVVVGPQLLAGLTQQNDVVGMAANVAHRVQTLAAPNTLLVSGETLSLVSGLFDAELVGFQRLRGLSAQVAVHRILCRRPDANRSQARLLRGALRLVGRTLALEHLNDLWTNAASRGCTVVQVLGEPGIGKTRLVQEFCQRLDLPKQHVMIASCAELFAVSPLYPVAQILRTRLGVGPEAPAEETRHAIWSFLTERGQATIANAAAAGALLGLDDAEAMPEGVQVRAQLFTLIAALVQSVVRAGPSVLWIDDVHWLDPSSAELLNEMLPRLADAHLIVILTQRRLTSVPGLPPIDQTINLHALERKDALDLARSVPGADSLPTAILYQVVEAADGVPLFLEQLILFMLGQQSNGEGSALHVPISLSEMIASRLDQVPGARRFALAASCVGRKFEAGLVAHVLDLSREDMHAIVGRLVAAEVLIASHDGTDQYSFRHALLHRAAYDATMRAERYQTHAAIYAALSDPSSPWSDLPEVLAHHLTEAGEHAAASAAWTEAGGHASRNSAHAEALAHLAQAATALNRLPPELRTPLELKMLVTSVAPLSARHGSASRELEVCCRRGLHLSLQTGPTRVVFPFLYGHCTVLMSRASTPEALELARLFVRMAEREGNLVGQVIARRLAAMALTMTGELVLALQEVELSLTLYEQAGRPSATETYGHDALVFGTSLLGLITYCLGDVEGGIRATLDALKKANELRHPHSTAIALSYAGWVFGLSGAVNEMNRDARRLIRIADEHRLGMFKSIGSALIGWSLCLGGELDQGIAVLQQALADMDRAEFGISVPGYFAVLADAQRRRGRLDEARRLIGHALATVLPGNNWLSAEVARVAALLEPTAQMVDALCAASELARTQANVTFEQRCLQNIVERASGPVQERAVQRLAQLDVPDDLALLVERYARELANSPNLSKRL